MNAELPPDIGSARGWRAVAFALAVTCAVLVGLLFLTIASGTSESSAADAGQKDAAKAQDEAETAKKGRIEGTVSLSGTPEVMRVPSQRKSADHCKSELLPDNAVLAKDGKLKDVLVRIENGGARGDYVPPDEHVIVEHASCVLSPRIRGAMIGQELEIRNRDPVAHHIHAFRGAETWFSRAEPKGDPVTQMVDAPGIVKLTCDVHPWERAFVVVSDHPYFAVTGEDGAFAIPDVPYGRVMVETWHARYGQRRIAVDVGEKTAAVTLTYDTADPAPEINKGDSDGAR